ncbi:hypothetical protein BH09PLA1_BH09PLA1_25860 [soil metagenome]
MLRSDVLVVIDPQDTDGNNLDDLVGVIAGCGGADASIDANCGVPAADP